MHALSVAVFVVGFAVDMAVLPEKPPQSEKNRVLRFFDKKVHSNRKRNRNYKPQPHFGVCFRNKQRKETRESNIPGKYKSKN